MVNVLIIAGTLAYLVWAGRKAAPAKTPPTINRQEVSTVARDSFQQGQAGIPGYGNKYRESEPIILTETQKTLLVTELANIQMRLSGTWDPTLRAQLGKAAYRIQLQLEGNQVDVVNNPVNLDNPVGPDWTDDSGPVPAWVQAQMAGQARFTGTDTPTNASPVQPTREINQDEPATNDNLYVATAPRGKGKVIFPRDWSHLRVVPIPPPVSGIPLNSGYTPQTGQDQPDEVNISGTTVVPNPQFGTQGGVRVTA